MADKDSLYFFWKLLKTNISHSYSLKLDFWLACLFMLLNNIGLLIMWLILFGTFKEINGWSIQHFALATGIMVFSESLFLFGFNGIGDKMAGYIERGELDTFLLQPRDVLLNISCSRSNPSAMGQLITGILLLTFSGFVTIQTFPLLLISIFCGFLAFISVGIFIGSLAFYLKEVEGWGLQILRIFTTFTTNPGSVYTGGTKLFLMFVIPAGLLTFMPVDLITHPTIGGLLELVGITAMFFTGAVWFFYRGLRRYESGNSFGVRG